MANYLGLLQKENLQQTLLSLSFQISVYIYMEL